MKPYEDRGKYKFKLTFCNCANPHTDGMPGVHLGISKMQKLITKNANRSLKKAERRRVKNEIKKQLNDI